MVASESGQLHRLTVHIDKVSRDLLEKVAAERSLSLSALVRVAIRALKVSAPPERSMEEIRQDIRRIVEEEMRRNGK